VKPLGVVAGAHNQRSSGVGSEAEESEELGHGGLEECLDSLVERGQLIIEGADPMSQRRQRGLGGRRHRVGGSRRPESDSFGHQSRD
jgi:hypothetical protein